MCNRLARWAIAGLLPWLLAGHAAAMDPVDVYSRQAVSGNVAAALGDDLFGDRVDLYTGTTTFSVTDLSIPGNSALPVAIRRIHTAGAKGGKFGEMHDGPSAPGLFGEWDLEIPHLRGMFSMVHGWQVVGDAPNARCSAPTSAATIRPPDLPYFQGDAYWNGHFLHIPGQVTQRMLLATTPLSVRPRGSAAYRWNTASQWHFSCTPLKNGGGEGFIGHAPDGTRYYFDWLVYQRNAPMLKWSLYKAVERSIGFLYPTRIEDRFGNRVDYKWTGSASPLEGHTLQSIEASDGRRISLSYVAAGSGLSNSLKISAVTDGTRTWRYQYNSGGYLNTVTLPDGSAWDLHTAVPRFETTDRGLVGQPDACTRRWLHQPTPMVYRMRHPSGVVGEFVFQPSEHGRARVSPKCHADRSREEDAHRSAGIYFFAMSLVGKTFNGIGLQPRSWTVSYGTEPGSWADCSGCNAIKQVQVTDSTGSFSRYYYSMHFGHSEGRLLEQHDGGNGKVLRKTWHLFDDDSPATAYPRVLGYAGDYWGRATTDAMQVPQRGSDLLQDGVTFSWRVDNTCNGASCFDAFARPVRTTRFNSTGSSKRESIDYHDDISGWVLGQVLQRTTNGIQAERTEFDATTSLPIRTYEFGALRHTLAYHPDGTLASTRDGNGNVTMYADYKRGIPQTIRHPPAPGPSSATRTATVSDAGWVTSVTDEAGNKTCFAHDGMGRVKTITHPSNAQRGVCDGSSSALVDVSFSSSHPAAYGVPALHWRQTTETFDSRRVLFLDALWRPIVEQVIDKRAQGATLRELFTRYDARGRIAFESYPMNTGGQAVHPNGEMRGVHTEYDALDRVIRTTQDSELGPLVTTTEYLEGGPVRVTDPRGQQTTTHFLMFDVPRYDWPIRIAQPEGVLTEIARDAFGKPTAVTRSGAGQ